MDLRTLEEIGLNKSEIRVYIALLKIGSSTTGPIINKSKTANSKIYEVLEKLIDKGLVSYFTKGGVKYYKAASPKMISQYLEEKKDEIKEQENKVEKIMPFLLQLEKSREEELEAAVFTGVRGVKTVFSNIVNELNKGEEVHILGVYNIDERFLPLALFFQRIRSKKGVKAKFLMNKDAIEVAKQLGKYDPVEIRFMPEGMLTPAIIAVYNDKVTINLTDDLTFFVLKSKKAAATFEAYFQSMWKNAKS